MNIEQIKWTSSRAQAILDFAKARDFVLDVDEWDAVMTIVNETYKKSKGNEEVKKVLMLSVEYIEKMQNLMRETK